MQFTARAQVGQWHSCSLSTPLWGDLVGAINLDGTDTCHTSGSTKPHEAMPSAVCWKKESFQIGPLHGSSLAKYIIFCLLFTLVFQVQPICSQLFVLNLQQKHSLLIAFVKPSNSYTFVRSFIFHVSVLFCDKVISHRSNIFNQRNSRAIRILEI